MFAVDSEDKLREIVGKYPKMLDKRILPGLDHYCADYISRSTFCLISIALTGNSPYPLLMKSSPDCLTISGEQGLEFTLTDAVENHLPLTEKKKARCSLYFLIPGVEFGLRVNGFCSLDKGEGKVSVYVEQAYVHCARAVVRSKLWRETTHGELISSCNKFIEQSSYALLCTSNAKGEFEISPRGEPEQVLIHHTSGCLLLADRPGNKVAVSLRNIIQSSKVALCLLIPGQENYLVVYADAKITQNPEVLKVLAIKGKKPKLAIELHRPKMKLRYFDGFEQGIWRSENHVLESSLPPFSKILAEHMNGEGLHGKLTTALVSTVVKHDRKNLY